MTDGPYSGSIRDDSDSGLGGIFLQLAAIASGLASLTQIAADIAAIRVLAERLIGTAGNTPSGWLGLPWAFGVRDGTGDETLMQLLLNIGLNANLIGTNTSSAASFTNTIRQAILRIEGSPQANLRQLLTALELVRDDVDALSLVTGLATDPPVGSTIKALLASIDVNQLRAAECCEEGQNPDPDPPPQNALPDEADSCAVGLNGPHQCTGLFRLPDAGGVELYGLLWGGLDGVSTFAAVNDATFGASFPTYVNTADQEICLRHDLTGNTVPSLASFERDGTVPYDVVGAIGTAFNFSSGIGSFFTSIDQGVGFWVTFEVPIGGATPNPGNFWLYWRDQPV